MLVMLRTLAENTQHTDGNFLMRFNFNGPKLQYSVLRSFLKKLLNKQNIRNSYTHCVDPRQLL